MLSVLLQFGTARSLRMDRQGGRSGPDTAEIFNEPGAMDAGFAVFCNLLEVDEKGTVTNFKQAERRAAGQIRAYCDPAIKPELPFENWEGKIHPVSERWNG